MVCRLARAPSTWTTLFCTSSRASESCVVISANERVRPPSSSREAKTAFELKSPCATWSTPWASSSSGCASWLLRAMASRSAPNTASTRVSVSVPMYILRRPLRASDRCWYSR